ncbi:enoyl-CoA hydratase/isomerase family protein [Brevibacterium samyangense]|uniref:Crotonase/enoyl-CoA hydratase family protein n=1 Tax=Brevibacterium samyangense TaxID=366888 RepID=A0ABN2TEZ6_9MICO
MTVPTETLAGLETDTLTLEARPAGVVVLRIERPERKGALRYQDLDALDAILDGLATEESVRALVLAGTPGAFCAGIDLSDLESRSPEDRSRSENTVMSLDRWRFLAFPKPVVAAVDGPAVGMGVEISCQADLRIASARALFAWNFGDRGLVPDMGVSPLLLPTIVGLPTALDLQLSGRRVSGKEAEALGYVSTYVGDADPVDTAVEAASRLSAASPSAASRTKALTYAALLDPAGHLARHDAALRECLASDDHAEGVRAFLEKRTPAFRAPEVEEAR